MAEATPPPNPRRVFVFSGKRKAGKDFLTDELVKLLPEKSAVILRLSGPLKKAYADEHGLDFGRLLDATDYKEKYRADMVKWGEQKRNEDPEYFCRLAINAYGAEDYPIWIVSDARRLTDLDFFRETYPEATNLCRVNAREEARARRGWCFTEGIDDAETECGLDDIDNWDYEMDNSGFVEPDRLLGDIVRCALLALEGWKP
ncbi:phosphomevalonate kinase-like [Tropilaelaps mercedesae]|uniref:Phosphomevalonate kinase n=1 Tax=Tropilaelaps mercedesae TaxID=418985 RepID=A0A1V9WYL1_9ACAR|nr:phosphomevalonate kinase-like [Tropilaelaps mercedesae]